MHLAALLCQDPVITHALARLRETLQLHAHPLPVNSTLSEVVPALPALKFAGALVLEPSLQPQAYALAQRRSLDAQRLGCADLLCVTPSGLSGEYLFGRALSSSLRSAQWDGRNARAVIIIGQSNAQAAATAKELSSLGAKQLVMLAPNQTQAEKSIPHVAANTHVLARAYDDPGLGRWLGEADLIARLSDDGLPLPEAIWGPHLAFVDLIPQTLSPARRRAMQLGGLTLGLRDIQATLLSLALTEMLSQPVDAEAVLDAIHSSE